MPITLTVVALDYRTKFGKVPFNAFIYGVTFNAFVFGVLNIMPRLRDNSEGLAAGAF